MNLPQRLYGAVRTHLVNRQFAVYIGIGLVAQVVDLGLFSALVAGRFSVEVAATISGLIATAAHFALNKYLNFRNHDRQFGHQLRTYLTVGAVGLALQIGAVSVLTRLFFFPPLPAKVVVNALSFPMNFLLHRYFTFGRGIRGAVSAWLARRPAPAAVLVIGREEAVAEAPL